jgi:hypothetical protein
MTTTMTTTTSCLTKEEQATLKTALAFVVLRNRNKKRKATTQQQEFSFCRNLLLTRTTVNEAAPALLLCDKSHIASMLQMALAAAAPLCSSTSQVYTHATTTTTGRLTSLGSHLARHLTSSNAAAPDQQQEWIMQWIQEATLLPQNHYTICTICCVWHCIAASGNNNIELILLQGIGQLIGKIYHNQVSIIDSTNNADSVVVNLLLLLEALISMRLEATHNDASLVLKNLVDALQDPTLTLPIAVEDMPLFCHEQQQSSNNSNNLSVPSKILLHLSLYDLTLKLTGV